MTEEQRKQAYAEMERRMAQSSPVVDTPVKSAPDRSAMQERMDRILSPQEKESPSPVPESHVVRPIPVIEPLPPVVEPPKARELPVTVESPVVRPLIEQPVPDLPSTAPHVKATLPMAENTHEPYLQPTPKKPVNWLAWAIGLVLLAVIAEIIWVLVS